MIFLSVSQSGDEIEFDAVTLDRILPVPSARDAGIDNRASFDKADEEE